jgi:two-component system nitrogen regulation response regulator NtrX
MYVFTNSNLRQERKLFEKAFIEYQLRAHSGNVARTADTIGMERSAFHRKIKKLSICARDFREGTPS